MEKWSQSFQEWPEENMEGTTGWITQEAKDEDMAMDDDDRVSWNDPTEANKDGNDGTWGN